MYDFVIIGAGINGCFIAHQLAHYNVKVAMIEKENDIANGTTMANSAIIHAGEDPEDGTLKAKFNVRGSRLYEDICKQLHCYYKKTSAFVVATSLEEEETLYQLERRAAARGIPATILSGEAAREKEENLSDTITKALELPTTAIVYPWEVAIALAEEAVLNGVEVKLNCEVASIQRNEKGYIIHTNSGEEICTRWIINAAGVYADRIYGMVSEHPNFSIRARKGEYYVIDHMKKLLVERVIYPVPSAAGKGVLAIPTVHNNIMIGPNSEFTDDKESTATTLDGLSMVKSSISKTIKNVPWGNVIRNFAGLRATGSTGDFIINEAEDAPCFINVAAIESPGLSSAPAIAEYVFETIISKKEKPEQKENFIRRKAPVILSHMTMEEKNELVKKDPTFGHIVCRCEQITEGEIIDAIHRPLGAHTVKGVKKRVRPGTGRCQGGFCEPHVMKILERELGIKQTEIVYDDIDSAMLKGGAL